MRVRLRAQPSSSKPRVDRAGDGRINGLSIITAGEARGHGFQVDSTTLDQVAKLAGGAKGRWTHGSLFADGLGTHLGRWENVRREGLSVFGDFVFSPAAKHSRPEGLAVDAPTYLMDLAEKDPEAAGVSALLHLLPFAEGHDGARLARVSGVPRADFVSDPAANPGGLFAGCSTAALDDAAEIHGPERVGEVLCAWLSTNTPALAERLNHGGTPMDVAAQLAAKDKQIADLTAGMTALKAAVDAQTTAELARKKRETDGYVAGLQAQAVAVQRPLTEAQLGQVRDLFGRGLDEAARTVGDALLSVAKAQGVAAPANGQQVVDLGTKAGTEVEAEKRGAAALLKAAGFDGDNGARAQKGR